MTGGLRVDGAPRSKVRVEGHVGQVVSYLTLDFESYQRNTLCLGDAHR